MTGRRFSPITSVLGLLALCVQLPAETMFVILKNQPQQAREADSGASGPLQDAVAARLEALGASDIRRYTVLNMLGATIPAPALPMLQRDPGIAAIVDADGNAGIIDRMEQSLAILPLAIPRAVGDQINEAVYHGTESFARLIDRIAAERDFTIFAGGDFASPNTILAASEIRDLQSALVGVTHNRHIVLRALAENAAAGNLGAAPQSFLAGSVSSQSGRGFQFYKLGAGGAFHATLAWDRHFTAGLDAYRRRLGLFLYDASGSQVAAAPTGAIASDAAGDLVLKVKLLGDASSPAGEETFALAMSRQGMERAQGPALDVNCSRRESILNCTVSNKADLPVFGVTAHLHGLEYALGGIEPGGIRSLSVPTTGYDPGDPHLTVNGEAFGEIVQAAAVAASSTPPDPPQLSLSCAYSTQTAQATVITCTITGLGGVPINGVTAIASSSAGDYRQVPLGTLTGGQTAQATYSYSNAGFIGSIWTQGTADQGLFYSNILKYPVANQPPTPGAPGTCTAEGGITDAQPYPAVAGGGSVVVKTQDGCRTYVSLADSHQIVGLTVLDYGGGVGNRTVPLTLDANILPDTSTTPLSRNLIVSPNIKTLIPATQAGLTCNFQPVASLLTVPASGYLGTVTMSVESNCQWTQTTTDFPTIVHFVQGPPPYMTPPPVHTGPGSVQYLIDATNSATDITFTMRVGGKILTGVQRGTSPPPPPPAEITRVEGSDGVQGFDDKEMIIFWLLDGAVDSTKTCEIKILSGDTVVATIPGIQLNALTYSWRIPLSAPVGKNYKVRITPGDTSIAAKESSNPIEVKVWHFPFDDAISTFMKNPTRPDDPLTIQPIPGAEFGLLYDGKLVYTAGYGTNDGKPNELFRVASLTKPVTAAAIYALKEQGKLRLGDKVFKNGNNGGILNLKGNRPWDIKVYDITVGQLLSHFGGWDNQVFGGEYVIKHRETTFPVNGEFDPMFQSIRIAKDIAKGQKIEGPPTAEQILDYVLENFSIIDAPGTAYHYSNLGYAVLGMVIAEKSGQPYQQYVKNMLANIGATNTIFGRTLGTAANETLYFDARGPAPASERCSVFPNYPLIGEVCPDSDLAPHKNVPSPYGSFDLESMEANGGLVTNVSDLLRFYASITGQSQTPILIYCDPKGPVYCDRWLTKGDFPYGEDNSDHVPLFPLYSTPTRKNTALWLGDFPGTMAILKQGDLPIGTVLPSPPSPTTAVIHYGYAVFFNSRPIQTEAARNAMVTTLGQQLADRAVHLKERPSTDLFNK